MKLELIDIILIVLFFQLIAITPFLLLDRKGKVFPKRMLGILLLSKALCLSNFICFRLGTVAIEYIPHLFLIGTSFTLLWGPTIYFYTKSLTVPDFRLKPVSAIHLIPFLIHLSYMSFVFHFHGTSFKQRFLLSGGNIPSLFYAIYEIVLYGTILIYLIFSFVLVEKYKTRIKDLFASTEKINLSWLYFVLIGFALKLIFDVWYVFDSYINHEINMTALYISRLVLFIFLNYMIYKGFQQKNIFEGIEEIKIGKKLSLSQIVHEDYKNKLLGFMENEKPYLDPDLTLQILSEKLNIPTRSLSEVINFGLNQNFYDFINSYRVRESEILLLQENSDSKTILEIIYESGFNSKSSFHKAFKKHNGVTPTEFKKLKSA